MTEKEKPLKLHVFVMLVCIITSASSFHREDYTLGFFNLAMVLANYGLAYRIF